MNVLVVDGLLRSEALGETTPPGAVLTRGLVAETWHDVLKTREGTKAIRRGEARTEQYVLVGERQKGAAKLVVQDCLERLVGLGVAVNEQQPTSSEGVPPMRSSVLKE